MRRTEIKRDNFTHACIVRACADSFDLDGLKLVHCGVMVAGLGLDSICSSALVSAYSRLSLVDEASRVFNWIRQPDLVLWNSMISGYGSGGFWDTGLQLFSEMRSMEMVPDGYTIVGLLWGLADSSLISIGEGIHGLCLKWNLDSNAHVSSVLVSMYSRCMSMNSAHRVFSGLFEPDLVTRSALITGFSQSGDYDKALFFFKNLNMEGKKPDSVLIASMLAAAAQMAHVGPGCEIHAYVLQHGIESDVMISSALIAMYSKRGFLGMDGQEVFRRMKDKFCIQARTEHYVHMVKLLGMEGRLEEAYYLILSLPEPVDSGIWGALLLCCDVCGNLELAEIVARRLFESNSEKSAYRVMLSNIYAGDGRWDDAKKLRDSITEGKLMKMPGLNWIKGSEFLFDQNIPCSRI
ncbi:hypothetical protein FF1_038872 [Malus domestica]